MHVPATYDIRSQTTNCLHWHPAVNIVWTLRYIGAQFYRWLCQRGGPLRHEIRSFCGPGDGDLWVLTDSFPGNHGVCDCPGTSARWAVHRSPEDRTLYQPTIRNGHQLSTGQYDSRLGGVAALPIGVGIPVGRRRHDIFRLSLAWVLMCVCDYVLKWNSLKIIFVI